MEIRASTIPSGPRGLDAPAVTAAPAPEQAAANGLDPPVKLAIGTPSGEARFVRDPDTRAMVFEVVDPASGSVIVQSPSETALRNRAYDESQRAHAATAARISRVA